MGIVVALNLGLAMARSPLVARLDADDIAPPGRLARQVETMQRDPALGLLGGFAEVIDESGRTLGTRRPPVSHEALLAALARDNPFIGSTVMYRTDIARAVGGYRIAIDLAEDSDLWLRMAERTRIANLPETLVLYRVHRRVTDRSQAGADGFLRTARATGGDRAASGQTRPDRRS